MPHRTNFPSFVRTTGPFSQVGALGILPPLSTASLKQHPDYLNGDILVYIQQTFIKTVNVYIVI